MSKKNKNIIILSIDIFLIIAIILTIHFAKDNSSPRFDNIQSNENFNDFRKNNDNDKAKPSINNKNGDESTDTIENQEEQDNKDILTNKYEKDNDNNKRPDYKANFDNDLIAMPRNGQSGMPTKYVVLLSLEIFLLGGGVMYLIMNNIDDNINKKTIKNKKTKEETD